MANLNDLTKDVTSKVINQNMKYIIEKVSSTVYQNSYNHLDINQDTAALIGCVTAASVSVSVELATTATIAILSELGLLGLDESEKPSLSIASTNPEA